MNKQQIKEVFVFKRDEEIRFDVFVSSLFRKITRKNIQGLIKDGKITLNGQLVKPKTILKKGDEIIVEFALEKESSKIEPQKDLPIEIISKHDDFIVINKPVGISVHPSEHEQQDTVVNWLLAHSPEIKNVGDNSLRPGIVHRLDKETSGLLIIALNQKSFEFFKKQFQKREIQKKYRALCWGAFEKEKGVIETFVGKSKANPTKQATSANREKLINPKTAYTEYSVLENNEEMSLLEINLKTGRKHQIRIHLQSIGHPLVGDKIYSTKETKQKNIGVSRMFLHASFLAFDYLDGESYEFNCPPPSSFHLI